MFSKRLNFVIACFGPGVTSSVVINSTRWVVPHRVAAMLVHSTRIAGAQLRPDLVRR